MSPICARVALACREAGSEELGTAAATASITTVSPSRYISRPSPRLSLTIRTPSLGFFSPLWSIEILVLRSRL